MRIVVDKSKCHGHGLCYLACPEVYLLDESGYCDPLAEAVSDALSEVAQRGASECPEGAISLVTEEER